MVHFQDNDDAPSVKYSLSEGDKSALAFCFFLAKLATDSNIADKVVVFDDPISSFDIGRKAATIRMLIDVSKVCKQLIVLSHNIFFAYDFFESIAQKRELGQCLTLQIAHSNGISLFKAYELDQEATLHFLKDYNSLNELIANGESDQARLLQIGKCIRTVLEGYLRLKFYRRLKKHEWLGDALEKIRSSTSSTDAFFRLKDQLAELEEINDYSKSFHHASTGFSEAEQVSESELKQYARRTINLVQLI